LSQRSEIILPETLKAFIYENAKKSMNKKVLDILKDSQRKIKNAKFVDKRKSGKIVYAPFYSSISLKGEQFIHIDVYDGGTTIIENKWAPHYTGRIEIRMGDYGEGEIASGTFSAPMGLEGKIISRYIANEASDVFWDCVEDWEKKHSRKIGYNENKDKVINFSTEKPQKFFDKENIFPKEKFDEMEDILKKVTEKLSSHSRIYGVEGRFLANSEERYFVNSEGSEIFTNYNRYGIYIVPKAVDEKNLLIPHYAFVFWSTDINKMPSYDELMEKGETGVKNLLDIIKSPIEKNGAYPTIMFGKNHGVLWHEIIGHALEGHRMQEDEYGNMTTLFKGRVGKKIAPDFIDIYDDPTIKDLDGHYKFDEEGIPAQRVVLVEKGILKNFLLSRQSAGYFKTKSNGHARANDTSDPTPRMSNLIVKSSNEAPFEELKEDLIRLCKKQKKPYGLIMDGSSGGWTLPDEGGYFNLFPEHIFRVYTNGKMERVRGIRTIGTTDQILENILKTGKNYQLFNGVCGAESGTIPQTDTAPEVLIRDVIIESVPRSEYIKIRNPVVK